MALELHVAGPGLDVTRRLEPGDPAVILGRDPECTICLPDPERNISRRHLSLWNEGDQLHFHVLSVVNGIDTAVGELPPGTRGVLAAGDTLGLAAFRIGVKVMEPTRTGRPDPDPWAEFQKQAAQLVPGAETVPGLPPEDDPFGDWGFHSTFGPGSPGGSMHADDLAPAADLQPFLSGLGLEASAQKALTHGELETIGRLTRIALQGLLQAVQTAARSRQQVGPEERTLAQPRETNALRIDMPLENKLYYLFGGQAAAAGFMPPDRAVAQLVAELTTHEEAMAGALEETVASVVREFDPEALKQRLLGGGPRIFESARAWEAFAREYAEHSAAERAWVKELLDRHLPAAYARALMRVKRNTTARPLP
jgi:predicted component of type VI protein secretion system